MQFGHWAGDVYQVIVVVDHDVNIHNYNEVVWKALCALDPELTCSFRWARGYAGPCGADTGLRIEDGNRCHAQVALGRFYAGHGRMRF